MSDPRFFLQKPPKTNSKSVGSTSSIVQFLQSYPEEEIWRLFVERNRYHFNDELYNMLILPLKVDPEKLESLTVNDIIQFAESTNNYQMLYRLHSFHADQYKDEKAIEFISKHKGWRGFELNEPGYLGGMIEGFNWLLNAYRDGRKVDVEFIKELHAHCTVNIIPDGGTLRVDPVSWGMSNEMDTLEGLFENIEYLKEVEGLFKTSGVELHLAKTDKIIWKFSEYNSLQLAKEIIEAVKKGENIYYSCAEDSEYIEDPQVFLTQVLNLALEKFENDLENSKNGDDTLSAVFSFLKKAVIHHPFNDGVGRTFSMLLVQYLLMQQGLCPVLFLNSNAIPGMSVQELVNEYKRANEEMLRILADPSLLQGKELIQNNINTAELLNELSQSEKDNFSKNIGIYHDARLALLPFTNPSRNEMRMDQNKTPLNK